MTKVETALLAQIRERLSVLLEASGRLSVLLPVLKRLAAGYEKLGSAARKTVAAALPELAELIEAAEDALK